MNRTLCLCVFSVSMLLFCTGAANAQSAGSGGGSFANAFLIPTVVCQAGTATSSNNTGSTATSCSQPGGGPKVLFSDIKVPSANNKDVLLMASLETSLLTDTLVSGSSTGGKSTASAFGSIVVTPHVFQCRNNDCSVSGNLTECTTNTATTPCAVFPNHVTFDERLQQLSATLSACTTLATGIDCTTPEMIDLLLSTMSAHAFNFLVHNLSSGVYQIQLEIEVTTTATVSSSVTAGSTVHVGVGAGSLVDLIVQAQTPFDTIKLCPTASNSTGAPPNACGP